jgi:hypothetical protein
MATLYLPVTRKNCSSSASASAAGDAATTSPGPDDVCPVCSGLTENEASRVIITEVDGTQTFYPIRRNETDGIECVITQSLNPARFDVQRRNGGLIGKEFKSALNIGDILTIRGVWNCKACNGEGTASAAMRKRMADEWRPY